MTEPGSSLPHSLTSLDLPLSVARTRPRADTSNLPFPTSEDHSSKCTRKRVERALHVTEKRRNSKKRKPSLGIDKSLVLYRSACEDILVREDSASLAKLIGQICAFGQPT